MTIFYLYIGILTATYLERSFLEDFRNHGLYAIKNYPEKVQNIINSVVNNRQLASYEHIDGVAVAFGRIDKKRPLSYRALSKDNCERYIPFIAENRNELEADFLLFFPALMAKVRSECKMKTFKH